MGQCQYRYNPSEQYARTTPGTAPETICGARTYPAIDEPELVPVVAYVGGPVEYRATGRFLPRGFDDPYCPAHGGMPEPPPSPVTMVELDNAYQQYLSLAERFQGAVPAVPPSPQQLSTPVPPGGEM